MKRKTSPGRPPLTDHKLTPARSNVTPAQLKTALRIAGGKTP
jgi:hypothetical protein